jgi:WD40 repeat protein
MHTEVIAGFAVLADGRVASGGYDGTVRVWDLARGEPPRVLEGNSDRVRALTVLPNGRLITGADDCSLAVWDPDYQTHQSFIADASILSLAVAAEGFIVAGCNDSVHFLAPPGSRAGTNRVSRWGGWPER